MNRISSAPYTQAQQSSIKQGEEQIELVTKTGLPGWNLLAPSLQLFIENAIVRPKDSVILFGCHMGVVAVHLSRIFPQAELYITDHNSISLEMAQLTCIANHINSINFLYEVELPQVLHQSINTVFIQNPKGRQLCRRWLMQAYHALVTNGSLYLAGANDSGIQSVIKDAQELFGNGRVLAYKKGNRLAQFIKTSGAIDLPEWAQTSGIAAGTWVEFPITSSPHTIYIHSLPGVFSFGRLDEGTEMLLGSIKNPRGLSVLDVGCGYGVIGLVAVKEGAETVHLVDNDLLAIASCRETLSLNGITDAQVFCGDLLDPVNSYMYDMILSNPPFHAGHAVDYKSAIAMVEQSYQALNNGGELCIVTNRFIRYDRLIHSTFGNVSILAESGKFHVLSGLKSR